MPDPKAAAVTLRLSAEFMERHADVKSLLDTWTEMMGDLDVKLAASFKKAADDLEALCDEVEVENIKLFELYRQSLRKKYSERPQAD
jgi:hypothetical protein